jgi:hypothetical protein
VKLGFAAQQAFLMNAPESLWCCDCTSARGALCAAGAFTHTVEPLCCAQDRSVLQAATGEDKVPGKPSESSAEAGLGTSGWGHS